MNIIKVGTYNIKHASDNGRYAADIGNLLKSYDLDIIGIQEIDVNVRRSGNKDILAEIAIAGEYPYYKFYKTIDYQNGDYGLGIISKYPIKDVSVTQLKNCKEQRIIVHSQIQLMNLEVDFLVTHFELGSYEGVRSYQFEQVKGIIKPLKHFVLTGDFNVQDWTQKDNIFEFANHLSEYNILNNPNNTLLTYSGKECIGFGILPIDNIITSQNFKILNPKMIDTYYSDHDLLICDLTISDD